MAKRAKGLVVAFGADGRQARDADLCRPPYKPLVAALGLVLTQPSHDRAISQILSSVIGHPPTAHSAAAHSAANEKDYGKLMIALKILLTTSIYSLQKINSTVAVDCMYIQ